MLEGMIGAALMIAAFYVGFHNGAKQSQPKGEPAPKTQQEMKREREFKRFIKYSGGGEAE